jgi:hypothetical protein
VGWPIDHSSSVILKKIIPKTYGPHCVCCSNEMVFNLIEGPNIEFAKTNKIDAFNEVDEKLTEASDPTWVCKH